MCVCTCGCVCVCLFVLIREIGGCWMPCYSMLWASVWIRVSLYGSDRCHQFCGELLIWNSLAITCQIKYNVINNLLQCIGTFVAFFEFISNRFFPSHFFPIFFGFSSLQYSRFFVAFHFIRIFSVNLVWLRYFVINTYTIINITVIRAISFWI